MKKALCLIALIALPIMLFAGGVSEKASVGDAETRVFIDDLGRSVTLPLEIKRMSPSGNTAQLALYAIAPEKLAGWGSNLSPEGAEEFLPYTIDLPRFGAYYGAKADLNKEAVMAASPEIIVDIGQVKGTKEDMINDLDALQNTLNIPVVFIEGTLETFPDMFIKLGEALGESEKAQKLSEFAKKALDKASEAREGIANPKTFYYTTSDDGLTSYPEGSFHTEAIELSGGVNAVPKSYAKSTATVNMESLYLWDPDVILVSSKAAYENVMRSALWESLSAVKNGNVFIVPYVPYSLVDTPPAIQMTLGLYWSGKTLYPNLYEDVDIKSLLKEYYSLAYSSDITDDRAEEILNP